MVYTNYDKFIGEIRDDDTFQRLCDTYGYDADSYALAFACELMQWGEDGDISVFADIAEDSDRCTVFSGKKSYFTKNICEVAELNCRVLTRPILDEDGDECDCDVIAYVLDDIRLTRY